MGFRCELKKYSHLHIHFGACYLFATLSCPHPHIAFDGACEPRIFEHENNKAGIRDLGMPSADTACN